jgi:PBP1b-binding outer membrane lipoprotein LpoB
MKRTLIIITTALLLFGCTNTDEKITNNVKLAATFAIQHVGSEFQTPLANYLDVAAKGVFSIDGNPTVQEVVSKVLAFIPQDVQTKFPFVAPTISTAVSLAYSTYGKTALTDIGNGLEAAAAPYITHQ